MIIESADIVKFPVISVIVITYNQERYISQCLDAILSQKVNVPYELIIAEDAGTDGTREICKRYQQNHPDIIRLLLQDKNRGLSGNYADVLALTRGKYIAQIAGDDFWCDENKLQMQYDYMVSHPKCGLCYTNVKSCDVNGNIIIEDYLRGKKLSKSFEEHLVNPCFLAPLTWMYKNEVKDMFENRNYTDESVAMALNAFANYEVYGFDACTAVYRQTPNSASSVITPEYGFRQYKGVLDTQLYFAQKYVVSEELKNKILLRGYLLILPMAIQIKNEDFVQEVREFMVSQNLNVDMIIQDLKQGAIRGNSRAYRIGKCLLKPLMWMKKA